MKAVPAEKAGRSPHTHTAGRLCLLILASLPVLFALQTWQTEYRFDPVRHFSLPVLVGEILVIVLAIVGGYRVRSALTKVHHTDLLLVGAWFVCALTTSIFAVREPSIALFYLATTVIHFLFGFAIWERLSADWARFARPLLIASAVGAFAYTLCVYGLALSVRNDPNFDFLHFGPGVSNVRQLGYYGLVLTGLSAGLLATSEQRRRPSFFIMVTAGFVLIAWSGGRAAFVAGILAAGICVALQPSANRRSVMWWLVTSWLLAALLSMLFVPNPVWGIVRIIANSVPLDANLNTFTSNRLDIWVETIDRIRHRPLLGHGEGQFRLSVISAGNYFNHPHNWLLQFLYQWGFVGTGLLLAFLARRLASVRKAVEERPGVAIPALGLIVGLTAMATLDGAFFYVYPVMCLVLAVAALAARPQSPPEKIQM